MPSTPRPRLLPPRPQLGRRPRAPRRRWPVLGTVALALSLGSVTLAHACLFSNVASASANGVLARRITAAPTAPRLMPLWAPFAFRQTFAPGQRIQFRENMREVARSMGPQALHWRVHWLFGDGTRAIGSAVSHTYRRPGLYRIDVQSDFVGPSGLKAWTDFDLIDVVVGAAPTDATWLRAPSATPTPRATAGLVR